MIYDKLDSIHKARDKIVQTPVTTFPLGSILFPRSLIFLLNCPKTYFKFNVSPQIWIVKVGFLSLYRTLQKVTQIKFFLI